jgi:hypothetical protein
MKKILYLAIVAALSSAGLVAAQGPGRGHGRRFGPRPAGHAKKIFGEMDADKNGEVTLKEMRTHAEKRRAEADINKDGTVTAEERARVREKRHAEYFAKLDKNNDGAISKSEAPERMKRWFDRVDKNGNGFLGKSEWASHRNDRAGKRHGMRRGHFKARDGKGVKAGGGKGFRAGPGPCGNKADLAACVAERFKRIDANGDGVIVPGELNERGPKGRHGRGRHGKGKGFKAGDGKR